MRAARSDALDAGATTAAFEDLLVHTRLPARVLQDLRRRMQAPDRHYHGTGHLALLWTRHQTIGREPAFDTPGAMRMAACAIAFHDAIIEAGRRDNEDRSAAYWRSSAPEDLTRDEIDWVDETIRATADHLAYRPVRDAWPERLRQRILDLDLTPLGEVEAVFVHNTTLLRREQPDQPFALWNANRLAFLRRMEQAPAIYREPAIAHLFEAQARRNIARELTCATIADVR